MKQLKNRNNDIIDKRLLQERHNVGLNGVHNARDLGGYNNIDGKTVKRGRLIRSGMLNSLTVGDKRVLIETLHTAVIVDFRTKREVDEKPDMTVQGARYINLPILSDEENDIKQALQPPESSTELYTRIMFGNDAKKAYKGFFEQLIEVESKHAVIFHSVHGRDRTGVAAALLLTALDVPEDMILEDYLLTKGVFVHTLQYALCLADVEYGSVKEYLKKCCGLNDSAIKTLKHKYLS